MQKLLLSSCILLVTTSAAFAVEKPYSLHHRIALSGGEGWDCLALEPTSQRLFVTRGNHVDVVDLKTEKVVGKISSTLKGAHDVAFVEGLEKGYITSGMNARVLVFNLKTLEVIKDIPTGKNPDILLVDKASGKIFVFNGGDPSVTVIDSATDKVLKTIPLKGKPEFAVVNEGKVYFNDEDKSAILVIDVNTMNLTQTWALTGCTSPSGLSADFKSQRLFSVCDNEVMAISDIKSGKVLKTVPIGKGPDGSEFDDGLVFSSNGAGSLTVVREKSPTDFEVVETLATQKGARTMTVDHSTHDLYLLAAKYQRGAGAKEGERPKIVDGSVEVLVLKR